MKSFLKIIVVSLFLSSPIYSQYNPFLRKKNKNKPSVKLARQNKKDIRKQNKVAKRQMRRSRRRVKR
jgi:hypothetical protein